MATYFLGETASYYREAGDEYDIFLRLREHLMRAGIVAILPDIIATGTPANATIRRNSRTSVFNSVIGGYPKGMSIRDASIAQAQAGVLQIGEY
mgnify:CR=1 FL=1